MSDEGFQEIHLGNKQLVFLAMTGCVVLVVAFLFGVLVGRGVGPQTPPSALEAQADAEVTSPGHASEPAPVNASPAAAPLSIPEPIDDELSYPKRLEGEAPATETLAAAKTSTLPPAPAAPREAEAAPAKPGAPPADKALAEPPGQGFAVQVVALRDRAKAEGVARRLAAKGHRAYLVAPGARGSAMYRVVVGKFKTRREAEQVKRRIEKEEQFKPWIIR
jgi:cell division septation protein DedD